MNHGMGEHGTSGVTVTAMALGSNRKGCVTVAVSRQGGDVGGTTWHDDRRGALKKRACCRQELLLAI